MAAVAEGRSLLDEDAHAVRQALECWLALLPPDGAHNLLPTQLRVAAINAIGDRTARSILWHHTTVQTFRCALDTDWFRQQLAQRQLRLTTNAPLRGTERVQITVAPIGADPALPFTPIATPDIILPTTHHYDYMEACDGAAWLWPDHNLLPVEKWVSILRGIKRICRLPYAPHQIDLISYERGYHVQVPLAQTPFAGDHPRFRAALAELYQDVLCDPPTFSIWQEPRA